MHRLLTLPALLAAGFTLCASGAEKETASDSVSIPDELRAIHQLLDRQAKEFDAINEQLAHLRQRLDAQESAASSQASPSPASVAMTPNASLPAPAAVAGATPEPVASPAPAPASPEPVAAEPPKAEPAAGGVKHVVAKGETLTSIAKQYNISVTALHAANKSVNDRKLQIGQVLSIPAPNPNEPSSPPGPEKKENP
jgi:LysM repeat protein